MASLIELRKIAAARTKGKWSSYYHNRVDAWAITHEKVGCDEVSDRENLLASAPDGMTEHSLNFDFIATFANHADRLLDLWESAEKYMKLRDSSCANYPELYEAYLANLRAKLEALEKP